MKHEGSEIENVQRFYGWNSEKPTDAHQYLIPKILSHLPPTCRLKVLDIGCGNGFLAGRMSADGHKVTAVDASEDGLSIGRKVFSHVQFELASVYQDSFLKIVGSQFDVVVSLEVIEHLFWPRVLLEKGHSALKPGGRLILSTPYHGYWKNLAISLANGWDRHFTAEWDGGHIKFFSFPCLAKLLSETGFEDIHFFGAGRFPGLWKSMIVTAKKGKFIS